MNESPAVGFVAVQARHPKRDRRRLRRVAEPHRESLDLDNAGKLVGGMGGNRVEADDLTVAVVARSATTGRSRAGAAAGERAEWGCRW